MPDFTNCSFFSRDPDADWTAVVHAGGPLRGFDVCVVPNAPDQVDLRDNC